MMGFSEALKGPQQQSPEPQQQGLDPKGGLQPQAKGTQASPELQKQYNRFFAMGVMMLWSDKFSSKAVKMLEQHPDPTDALASIGAAIVQRIYLGARKQGEEIPPEVVFHAGWELMGEIAEFAAAAGAQGIEQDDIETAYYMAADKVREALSKAGVIDQGVMEQDFEQIKGEYGDDAFETLKQRLAGAQQKTVDAMMSKKQGAQAQ